MDDYLTNKYCRVVCKWLWIIKLPVYISYTGYCTACGRVAAALFDTRYAKT